MKTIKRLFDSRKFVAALTTTLIAIAVELGIPEIQVEEILAIVSPMLAYIGAQGFADMGKEKAS
jgi:hypothetical protein